jgi:hypothetical protein
MVLDLTLLWSVSPLLMCVKGGRVCHSSPSFFKGLKMKEKLLEKLKWSSIGFGFTRLNLFDQSLGHYKTAIVMGFIACIFFIKSLTIRLVDKEDK